MAAARAGDAKALSRLVEVLSGPVYRFGRGFCGDPHDAEDVAQIVLAALVRTLRDFRGESSLTTWAYTAARRACTRHRRRGAHEPERFDSLHEGDDDHPALEVADAAEDPHRALEAGELQHWLERAIARLPRAQREVLLLRDVEGLPAREVGRVLDLGERAVKSRLHRARAAVRASLAPYVEEAGGTRGGAGGFGRHLESGRGSRRPGPCPDTVRLVSGYLEGEMDARACARLEKHVAGCPDCLTACQTLRAALDSCRRWGRDRVPAEVKRAVRRGLPAALNVKVAGPPAGR